MNEALAFYVIPGGIALAAIVLAIIGTRYWIK
jgi:hypothetical protein